MGRFYFPFCLFSSVQFSRSVVSYSLNRSKPGLPVHHQLPKFTQTHVHWVSDAIHRQTYTLVCILNNMLPVCFLWLFVCFWPHLLACRILVSQPWIEPQASAVKTRSPNHWTARKFLPLPPIFKKKKRQHIIIFATYSSLSSFWVQGHWESKIVLFAALPVWFESKR